MTSLLLSVMGFKEIAVHQESYCVIFSAGMSSACVVDIGAQQTSITFVDEGLINADTRIKLNYGGDDITTSMVSILERSSFPYRDLDLAKSQEWLMMDNLKIKICTLEEHLVASTPWDFYHLRSEGLTEKYNFRTYDENILAPLVSILVLSVTPLTVVLFRHENDQFRWQSRTRIIQILEHLGGYHRYAHDLI
jgi:actin-related protein 8